MNIFDFFDKSDYEYITEHVEKQQHFEFEKIYQKVELSFHSSHARCDFADGTKNGEYIILYNYNVMKGNYASGGGHISSNEFFEAFADFDKSIMWIDSFLSSQKIPGYTEVKNVQLQLSFF